MEKNVFCVRHAEVEWEIPRFLDLCSGKEDALGSPEFYLDNASWCLSIFPYGYKSANHGEISLYLTLLKGSGKYELAWTFKMEVDGHLFMERERELTYVFGEGDFKSYGYPKFATRMEVSNYLCSSSTGTVKICCSASVLKESSSESKDALQRSKKIAPPTSAVLTSQTLPDCASNTLDVMRAVSKTTGDFENLSQDFEKLFLDGLKTDLKIKVRGQEFSAHTLVLSARSPVISAMFQHEMAENNTGVIEINDMNPECFQDFLHFMYSGNYSCVTTKNAAELYKAADKYDVKGLKEECVSRMKENFSLEIILDAILIANTYDDESLLDSAIDYFIKNAEAIYETEKWEDFFLKRENSKLAKELMIKALKKEQCIKK